MEFHQLTYFLAAAQTQNFRKAAELCLVAQSALSRQIAALEAELEVELFMRKKRRVILTAAGQEFAEYVRGALEQLQQGQQLLTELRAGYRGTVLIGCVESLATSFLPPFFASFHREYPHVHLKVRVNHTSELVKWVEQGVVELGLLLDPSLQSELLIVTELFRQSLQLLVPLQHPFVAQGQASVTLQQVAGEALCLLDGTSRLGQITTRIFAQRGLQVRPTIEIESVEGLKELVRQGVGVALTLPALVRPTQIGDGLALLPVTDVTEEFIFALVYRRFGPISHAARALINTIQRQATLQAP
ncbi:LysR family transcriptional regulator [Ktedonosporobacter rubrisoli]|uniref:LysR family transcriptional regulator n=1 Tax=Ktedonosporobacter rubrisoli TaxID=2509675 RepID=A0A4P6JQA8_KTERU|nr:LysR family transcriptional regulator [Ktedonosporobacter rubrisoli]QBD77589.1 LysR family transcriptional regulator [Ktedonosporobacter rubrisoli]